MNSLLDEKLKTLFLSYSVEVSIVKQNPPHQLFHQIWLNAIYLYGNANDCFGTE